MKRRGSSFNLSGPGLFRLFLLLLLLVWGFLIGPLRAYSNDILQGGLFSLVVVLAIAGLFYLITLLLAGSQVLPVHPRDKYEKGTARQMLQSFATGGHVAMAVVREAKVLSGPDGESREGITGPGVVDLDSTTAAVLLMDTGQSRIKEPGLIFLRPGERLGTLVDLRIQMRAGESEYLTRDGIPVRVRVTVRFQIDQTHFMHVQVDAPAHPLPVPVVTSQHSIRRAVRSQSVQASGETTQWHEAPLGLAQGLLRAMIADYSFDDLLQPREPTANPRAAIRKELEAGVRTRLAQHGIKLLALSLGVFFPKDYDPKVEQLDPITRQRVEAWKAEWESRMLKIMAQAQAEADRQHDLAHTQAQMELITRVTQALEQGGPPSGDQDQIARRFLSTLQRMADEQLTRERLGEEDLRMWNSLLGGLVNPDTTMPHEPPTES